jgi:hypothetical protein
MNKTLLLAALGLIAAGADAQDAREAEFFGRLDLGNAPRPDVINPRAVKGQHVHGLSRVLATPLGTWEAPVYFHVRPGEEHRWAAHCKVYAACDTPVIFVTEAWYRDVYLSSAQDGREQRYRETVRLERSTREQRHRDNADQVR